MRNTETLDNHPPIKGPDFSKTITLESFTEQLFQMGFQGTNLGMAIQLVNQMIADDAKIYIAMTGNAISSGIRDIITHLVKEKKIAGIITSSAGVEEDIIKCFKPFVVGDFSIPGRTLFEKGVGRIGNILAPFDRYLHFEEFIDPFLKSLHEQYKGKTITARIITKELGLAINNEESFLYWAAKHDIPVYCPAIQDGALGDLFYFFKQSHADFVIDIVADTKEFVDATVNEEGKIGGIILGGGTPKHFLLNSCILREGLDYAVYLTTAHEFDGSDSGGNQEEAKSWAKIKVAAPSVKVVADFTLTFPLLVAGTFAKTSAQQVQKETQTE